MALRTKHTISVTPVSDPNKLYCFEVICSCGWQGLAAYEEQADHFVELHMLNQKARGHAVEVVRSHVA